VLIEIGLRRIRTNLRSVLGHLGRRTSECSFQKLISRSLIPSSMNERKASSINFAASRCGRNGWSEATTSRSLRTRGSRVAASFALSINSVWALISPAAASGVRAGSGPNAPPDCGRFSSTPGFPASEEPGVGGEVSVSISNSAMTVMDLPEVPNSKPTVHCNVPARSTRS
jgi:hypothetical protein